jgi:hypothetical protein
MRAISDRGKDRQEPIFVTEVNRSEQPSRKRETRLRLTPLVDTSGEDVKADEESAQ